MAELWMQSTLKRSRKISPCDSNVLAPFCSKGDNSLNLLTISLVGWLSLLITHFTPVQWVTSSGPAHSGSLGLAKWTYALGCSCAWWQPAWPCLLSGERTDRLSPPIHCTQVLHASPTLVLAQGSPSQPIPLPLFISPSQKPVWFKP